jgi:hypothetical protein
MLRVWGTLHSMKVRGALGARRAALIPLWTAFAVAGCGAPRSSGFASSAGGTSDATGANGSGMATSGSSSVLVVPPTDGGANSLVVGGGQGSFAVVPPSASVSVMTGQPLPTVTFQALDNGAATNAGWSIDRGEIGSMSGAGVFTPSGSVGGTAKVTATYGSLTGTATVTVQILATQQGDPAWSAIPAPPGAGGYGGVGGDGPAGPATPSQMAALAATPTADATVSLIYPYDATVFPQGILAPLLQWDPGKHVFDGAQLRIKSAYYEYIGSFTANKTPFLNLPIPQSVWNAMTLSAGGATTSVTLVFSEGGRAVGPFSETWTIAPTVLHGTIYYNSYGTSYVDNSPYLDAYGKQFGAGTLAIAPGATAPTLAAGINSGLDGTGCRVCHTVSGDGALLVTQATTASASNNTVYIDLANDATKGAGTALIAPSLAFPALSKNGSLLFSSAGGLIDGDSTSRLYAMPSATLVAGVTGLPVSFQSTLPSMSPDSKHVAFNFWGGSFSTGAATIKGDKASLAALDFDGVSAFSNPRVLFSPPAGSGPNVAVTFSSFLPDSSGVVFALQLSNPSGYWGYTWGQNTNELWWVDLATTQAHRLDSLNGYGPSGQVYLPDNADGAATHKAAQDATLNYEPTVGPIAAGGYAWVVFTSRRMYGNVAAIDPWKSDPRTYKWLDQVSDKKLWVAAIDLGAAPGTDPSHPAFYLPAQELYAGNSRGFWSLDVCKRDGQSCVTGDQCCGGYCQQGDGGLACGSQRVAACAALYDKCSSDADCCGASQGTRCIDSVCGASSPPR